MKERSHDLVILDRMLPSMDGITVLQEARKNQCFHTGDHADCTGRITG